MTVNNVATTIFIERLLMSSRHPPGQTTLSKTMPMHAARTRKTAETVGHESMQQRVAARVVGKFMIALTTKYADDFVILITMSALQPCHATMHENSLSLCQWPL